MADEVGGSNRGQNNDSVSRMAGKGWLAHVVRFIVSAVVLMVVSYVTPGFSPLGFWYALLAAVLIVAIGYVLESLVGRNISPYARGGVGFIVSAAIFYLIQFLIPGLQVSILGALIAALIVGIIDMFVPTGLR